MLDRARKYFALERNVAVVSLTYVIAISAAGLWIDFLPAYFESLGATASVIGILFSFYFASKAVFHFLGGYMSDIFGRKPVYTLSFAIWAVAALLYQAAPEWVFLLPAILIAAVGDGVGQTSDSVLISESVGKKRRATSRATTHIIGIAAAAVTFPIGGLIMQQMGIQDGMKMALLISSGMCVVAATVSNFMLRETLRKPRKIAKPRFDVISNLGFVFRLPYEVKAFVITRGFSLFAWGISEAFFVLYGLNVIKIQPIEWGILTTVGLLSFGVFTFVGGKISDRYGRKNVILVAWIAAASMPLMFAFSSGFLQLALAQMVAGVIGIGMSSVDAYTADHTKKSVRGRSIGVADSIFTVSMIASPFIGGLLFSVQPQTPFIVSSFLGFASVLIGWKFLR